VTCTTRPWTLRSTLDDAHGEDTDAMTYGMVVVGIDGSDSALGAVERDR
jgi:hypothetical protein